MEITLAAVKTLRPRTGVADILGAGGAETWEHLATTKTWQALATGGYTWEQLARVESIFARDGAAKTLNVRLGTVNP